MGENIMWKQHGCEWSHVCFLTHCMKIKCESMRWWMFVQQTVSKTSMWTFPWKLYARDVFNFTWTFTEIYTFIDQFVWPWPNVRMTGASEKEKGLQNCWLHQVLYACSTRIMWTHWVITKCLLWLRRTDLVVFGLCKSVTLSVFRRLLSEIWQTSYDNNPDGMHFFQVCIRFVTFIKYLLNLCFSILITCICPTCGFPNTYNGQSEIRNFLQCSADPAQHCPHHPWRFMDLSAPHWWLTATSRHGGRRGVPTRASRMCHLFRFRVPVLSSVFLGPLTMTVFSAFAWRGQGKAQQVL